MEQNLTFKLLRCKVFTLALVTWLILIHHLNYLVILAMPPPEPIGLSTTAFVNTTTKKPIDPKKNLILCEINVSEESRIFSSCDLFSYNFTFYAYFREKRSLHVKTLQDLAQTLRNHSLCNVNYMKYNFWNENLEYLDTNDYYFSLYEGKRLNDTFNPEVYIIPDANKKGRNKIIYECQLPKPDVYLSMKSYASRSSHSRPIEPKKVTVSALHIKLHFSRLDGINVNLIKMATTTTSTTKFYYYSDNQKTKSGSIDESKSTERYMIFYDGKCRNCYINVIDSTIDSSEMVDPTFSRSIKCHLKANSCVNNGKCYTAKEASLMRNQFFCDNKFNEISTSLYVPCSVNNGGCDKAKCIADEFDNKIGCSFN